MGADKALVRIAGRPMVDHIVSALTGSVDETVVIGRDGPLAGLKCVADLRPAHRGPLAGLATAMPLSAGRAVLLVAVDQPLLRPETIAGLVGLARHDRAVVPIDDDSRQVTCAIYPPAWAAAIDEEDTGGGSIQSLLDEHDYRAVLRREWESWGEDGRSWRSLDTPEDVAKATMLLEQPR